MLLEGLLPCLMPRLAHGLRHFSGIALPVVTIYEHGRCRLDPLQRVHGSSHDEDEHGRETLLEACHVELRFGINDVNSDVDPQCQSIDMSSRSGSGRRAARRG
jgi:hypothetical protein